MIKEGPLENARARSEEVLPFWDTATRGERGVRFFHDVVAVALALGSAAAFGLLAPFGPEILDKTAAPDFAVMIQENGIEWAKRLFNVWAEKARRRDTVQWLPSLPALAQVFTIGGKESSLLARWLLEREVAAWRKRHDEELRRPVPFGSAESVKAHTDDLAGLLMSAAVIEAPSARDVLVELITGVATALPAALCGDLLKACKESAEKNGIRVHGLQALHAKMTLALEQAIATPERHPDDWSIRPPTGCQCALCKELSAFLAARSRTKFEWPLAKDSRAHVHQVIDRHELSVTHTTVHEGRPHRLVLIKQQALFKRETAVRERQKKSLDWLRCERTFFVSEQKRGDPTAGAAAPVH